MFFTESIFKSSANNNNYELELEILKKHLNYMYFSKKVNYSIFHIFRFFNLCSEQKLDKEIERESLHIKLNYTYLNITEISEENFYKN
jgi:hypothetical protein